MEKKSYGLLAWLCFYNQAVLVDGFAAPKQNVFAATKNDDIIIESVVRDADNIIEDGLQEFTTGFFDEQQRGEVDRRHFFVSMIGAASMLALSEEADAIEGEQKRTDTTSRVDDLSSTVLASTDAVSFGPIFEKASKKALGGGKAGAAAAVVQVCTLMWLRTSMNYQYRFGGTLSSSLKELYSEGGIPRLYQGIPFALVQGPLTRFGDTAANVGILALLDSIPETSTWPLPLKTAAGSVTAGLWRIFLMPIDTSKTAMQVEGSAGLERLKTRVFENGPSPLYQGAIASAAATAAGHFPWFLTYNFLNDAIPVIPREEDLLLFLVRSAALGLCASCVSDCVSNSLRVIKTTKQTAGLGGSDAKEISYQEALQLVLETDGVAGLLGRGLQTRLLTNALQGAIFSVFWKYFQSTL